LKLPDGWKKMKLEDVSKSINAGGTPRRNIREYWDNGDISWLKISDLKSVYVSESEEKITRKGLENSSAKLFSKGTILFSIFATLGAISILEKPSTTNQAIAGIVPKKELMDVKFLYYALKAEKNNIIAKKTHATQDNINLTILRKHEIVLPPLATQKNIVSILEKAEQLKQWRKDSDKMAIDYLNSIFWKMFGDPVKNHNNWPIKTLNEVCKKITDGAHGSPPNVDEGDIPYITAKNITKEGFNLDNITYVSRKNHEEIFKRCNPEKGDVLYIKDGVTTGIAQVNYFDTEFSMLSSVALLKPSSSINPHYLAHLLNVESLYKKIRCRMAGAAITRLTLVKIKNITIPVPPIELQNKFADIVTVVAQVKETQRRSKKKINELLDVLMQKAFMVR
jgi:type I restriction enzyme S subunit